MVNFRLSFLRKAVSFRIRNHSGHACNGPLHFWGFLTCNSGDFCLQFRPFLSCKKDFDRQIFYKNIGQVGVIMLPGVNKDFVHAGIPDSYPDNGLFDELRMAPMMLITFVTDPSR